MALGLRLSLRLAGCDSIKDSAMPSAPLLVDSELLLLEAAISKTNIRYAPPTVAFDLSVSSLSLKKQGKKIKEGNLVWKECAFVLVAVGGCFPNPHSRCSTPSVGLCYALLSHNHFRFWRPT